jgi:hypothetical protein
MSPCMLDTVKLFSRIFSRAAQYDGLSDSERVVFARNASQTLQDNKAKMGEFKSQRVTNF